MTNRSILIRVALMMSLAVAAIAGPRTASLTVDVRIVADEADAVISILEKRRANQSIAEADWQRLFASEGYVRLKKREAEMKRAFEDEEFKTFILSEPLAARTPLLELTLTKWKSSDVREAAKRVLAYLPREARIKAEIYPVIKPRENSFVFEVNSDPAIFLYLDPAVTREQFENTLAHELHHIGYGGSCPSKRNADEISRLPKSTQSVIEWIGAFGEGFAMLAAAGGPDVHPHSASKPEDRERWDRDVANFNDDLKKVEGFFLDVLANKLTDDQRRDRAFSFFGIQGPWYTVGWKMAVTIEQIYGRARLIECMCDQRQLLSTYNEAALKHGRSSPEPLALWSRALVEGINGGKQ
jgi:hypothetical protein